MKWRNHKLCTLCIVFAVTGRILPSFIAGVGSILPDVIEAGLVKHRTITHWPFLYLGLILTIVPAVKFVSWWAWLILGCLLIGCLLHLAEDSLSKGGIPLFNPVGKKYGLGWYITDTITETFVVTWIVAVTLYFSWRQGFLSADFLSHEIGWLLSWT